MYIIDNISGKSVYASQIHTLDKECFPNEFWSAELIEKELCGTRAVYLACFLDGTIIGYVNASIIPGEAELNRIAVAGSFRRTGVASLLLDELKNLAGSQGCLRINLEVRKSNSGAQLLYKEHGYVEDAVRTNYYHNPDDDAILMSLHF